MHLHVVENNSICKKGNKIFYSNLTSYLHDFLFLLWLCAFIDCAYSYKK